MDTWRSRKASKTQALAVATSQTGSAIPQTTPDFQRSKTRQALSRHLSDGDRDTVSLQSRSSRSPSINSAVLSENSDRKRARIDSSGESVPEEEPPSNTHAVRKKPSWFSFRNHEQLQPVISDSNTLLPAQPEHSPPKQVVKTASVPMQNNASSSTSAYSWRSYIPYSNTAHLATPPAEISQSESMATILSESPPAVTAPSTPIQPRHTLKPPSLHPQKSLGDLTREGTSHGLADITRERSPSVGVIESTAITPDRSAQRGGGWWRWNAPPLPEMPAVDSSRPASIHSHQESIAQSSSSSSSEPPRESVPMALEPSQAPSMDKATWSSWLSPSAYWASNQRTYSTETLRQPPKPATIPEAVPEPEPEPEMKLVQPQTELSHKASWASLFVGSRTPRPSVSSLQPIPIEDSKSATENTLPSPTLPATIPAPRERASSNATLGVPTDKLRNFSSSPKSLSLIAGSGSLARQRSMDMQHSPTNGTFNGSEPPHPRPLTPLTSSRKAQSKLKKPAEENAPNLVLPTFEDTFNKPPRSIPPPTGKLRKLGALVNSYVFSAPPPRDVVQDWRAASQTRMNPTAQVGERLPKLKSIMGHHGAIVNSTCKVAIIGVHGWFPRQMVSSIIGEPTGTSKKFSSMMSKAVKAYLENQGVTLDSEQIAQIPLEGEGKVSDRVERLYNDLVTHHGYMTKLLGADHVFVVAHSQGSVVSAQLLARLIHERHVKGSQAILMCMCSVGQGPFVSLSASWGVQPLLYLETAAARELFDFQDPNSDPSAAYTQAVTSILSAGARLYLIASLNDQVVPLYSALGASLSHPSILRAIFVDAQAFQSSDFITNLVVFATRLLNAGLTDHGLLYHLSEALAGSLTGIGHSTLYDEQATYELAVQYMFEATSPSSPPTSHLTLPIPALQVEPYDPRARSNPYYLPWALRGMIEDTRIRDLFNEELMVLRESFDKWSPVSKQLKDLKYKLEPLRLIKLRGSGHEAETGQEVTNNSKNAKL